MKVMQSPHLDPMRHARFVAFLFAVLAVGLLYGCGGDPKTRARRYAESGDQYFRQQKYREASIQYSNSVQANPNLAEVHYKLAQCFLKLGIWQEANRELLRTLELQPENPEARVDLGNLFLGARQFRQAQAEAELVLKQDPRNVDAHILRANALAGQDNLRASLQEMQTAIQLAPELSRAYWNLGMLQLGANQSVAAEQSFKKALEIDPNSSATRLSLGGFYQRQRRWADAEQQFRRAIELEPGNVQARDALVLLYLAQADKSKAEQAAREAKLALRDSSEGYRLLGDYYFRVADIEKAIGEYASLLNDHPRDLRVKKNYVELLILRNRLDEASRLNAQILKENRSDVDGLISQAQILYRQGRPNDAIPVLESALKFEPDNAVGHYQLGVAYNLLGNLGRAEAEWRESARLRPNLVSAQEALANLALRKGDASLLELSGQNLVQGQPLSAAGYVYRGMARIQRGDRARGEADLLKAIEVAPQDPLGYARLAAWRASQKRYKDAETLYEQALTRNPDQVDALEGVVGLYVDQKQLAKALARVDAQIARSPQNSAYYYSRAKLLAGMANLEAAETALQKAVELNKNYADALVLLGFVEFARGKVDQSIASYERNLQQNPRDLRSYMVLAQLHEMLGNWQKAQQLYERALQAQTDYPPAAASLAYILLDHGGNSDVDLSLAQVARRGLPDSPLSADVLGWAYYQKGTYGLAADLLQEAVRKAPENPHFHYHLGLTYQKLQNTKLAREHLSRVLQLNPQYPRGEEIRRALAQLGGD
jgi:tetratricopeptide (TPR) repeat protein